MTKKTESGHSVMVHFTHEEYEEFRRKVEELEKHPDYLGLRLSVSAVVRRAALVGKEHL